MSGKAKFSDREQFLIARELIEQRYKLAGTIAKVAGWVAAVYFGRDVVIAIAGKETALALKLSLLGDVKFQVSIALAGATTVWALIERNLRYRKVEHLQGRIRELETGIDPTRSTSGLTPKGKTNPKDKKP